MALIRSLLHVWFLVLFARDPLSLSDDVTLSPAPSRSDMCSVTAENVGEPSHI